MKLAASLNQRWMLGGRTLGMLAALNYTNEYRTYENMENNLYGIYDDGKRQAELSSSLC